MSGPSANQAYREDLRGAGDCRDCEAPLLADETNRCGVCRVLRKLKTAQRGGADKSRLDDLQRQLRDARAARIRILGHDDGAGDRKAVRAGGRSSHGRRGGRRSAPPPAKLVEVRVRMPADLHRRILRDAADRGESVEAWMVAAARETFEAPDPGEGEPA